MRVEQYVVAYSVEQDRIRALLPDGFTSLRPVLRINAEIREADTETIYVELNTAIEAHGKRGWLNVGHWDSSCSEISYQRSGKSVTFFLPFLTITYTGVGIEGSCPAEKDNDGCFFLDETVKLRPAEPLPAYATEPQKQYKKQSFSVENAAVIPCEKVLGSYVIKFERERE